MLPCLYSSAIACASAFFWSGTARARSFCTHQRSRLTNIAFCQLIIHAGRRQLQLSRRRSLHGCTTRYVRPRSRHIFSASLAGLLIPRNKDDMGNGVLTDQLPHNHCNCPDSHCNSHIVASCMFVLLVPTTITRRRWRVPSMMSTAPSELLDEPEMPEHEVPEPEDAHEEGKPCVICQDTMCQHTICQDTSHEATLPGQAQKTSECDVYQQPIAGLSHGQRGPPWSREHCALSVSHPITRPADHRRHGHAHGSLPRCPLPTRVPSTDVTFTAPSPVIEYVAPSSAVTYMALAPVIEHVPPAPAVTYDEPATVIEYVEPAPAVFYAAPSPVIECSSLCRISKISQDHEPSYIWERRKK